MSSIYCRSNNKIEKIKKGNLTHGVGAYIYLVPGPVYQKVGTYL